tara:strand:+ start:25690 stop:26163 length:474 start_codon:yes stop_codon:yes gene_type:complete
MRYVNFYGLLLILFLVSCGRKESNIPIYGYSLHKDSIKKITLNIIKKEGLINFEYRREVDSLISLDLKYNVEGNFLISDFDTFLATKKVYNSKSLEFNIYQRKEINNRTLFFNKKYGLLSSIAYGTDFLFLKDSISVNTKELIFKELFLNLNKINIE